MFRNYFKIAFRNIYNSKIYSFINIAGLAIGLACFILITIFIKNELSYDNFHKKADRIYRPVEIQFPPGVGVQHVAVTMGPLAPALKNDFPEILDACRIKPIGSTFCKLGDKGFYENEAGYADPATFRIFTIPFVEGDSATALNDLNSIVISQEIAKKYFGNEDPLGKTLNLNNYFGSEDYRVTGVFKDYPENSHLNFNMLASYITIEKKMDWLQGWFTNTLATYVLLADNASVPELETKFPQFLKKYRGDDPNDKMQMYLQPLKDIHLRSGHIVYQTFNHNMGSISSVYTFSIIAIFILLIACINFMNLATARSAKRAKEVGIRKVLGSARRELVYQFLGESLIISFIAFFIALLLAELAFSYFQTLFPDRIILSYTKNWSFLLQLIGLTLLVGIVAGSYPAFFLSRFRPAETLKGTFTTTSRGAFLRKALVVFQFAIAITLIASTGIVSDQMNYIRNANLGFNKDQVVYMPLRDQETKDKFEILKNELLRNPNILDVSATAGLAGASGSQGTMHAIDADGEVKMMMRFSYVDFDYLKTMGMELAQGRDFSPSIASDTVTSVIINQAAVKEFGWQDPIGKQFKAGDEQENYSVIGVVKDFHFYSFRQKIEPLIMWVNPRRAKYLVAKIRPTDVQSTLAYMEKVWDSHLQSHPFESSFLDAYFENIYRTDQNTGRLFSSFSFLAIFIGCLGLFGLASFTVEQKTKEIGIRKVLGAGIGSIVLLLTKEFTKWVAFATIIGFPVAYFASHNWLDNFVYKTNIHVMTFVLAGLLVVAIALLTVSFQAVKASLTNPVNAMRYE